MLRRITALVTMLALLALIGVLIWQVYLHRHYGSDREPVTLVKFALYRALIS